MKKVIAERKDIAFYIILYPLPMHKEAYEKSKAVICEKSISLLESAYDKKPIPKAGCETSAVDQNIKLAEKLGINGTPAMIFPDGIIISGAVEADAIIKQASKK